MSGEVGSAYIRIRPNLAGFRTETEGGVKAALIGAAKVAGGIFAIEGLVHETESVAKAAADQQAELAAVRKAVDNTGASWKFQGETVAQVLQDERRKLGFAVTELGQGFIRIESGVKNTAESFRLLSDAEDIARARHLGLAQASVILARAAQGSDTALRRLGIIIPKLSTNVDELTKRHAEATEAGIKFTAGQQAQYKAALANAAALDKQASKANIIAEIERRFGGQAQRFAETSAGQFARAGENIHQLKVAIGDDLLPAVNSLAQGVIHESQALRESEGLHHALADSVEVVRAVFLGAKGAVEAISPELETAAHAIADIVRFAGAGGLLAFAVGFKAIAVGTSLATAVEARYQAVLAAGRGERVATAAANAEEAGSFGALTVAVDANTAALLANAEATGANRLVGTAGSLKFVTGAYVAQTAAVDANTAAVAANDAAQIGAGARLATLGRGLFTLAGGWTTLAAVGIGAATFGLYKFITAETDVERANDRMRASLDELGTSLNREAKLAHDLASAVGSIKSDRVAVESAKASLALARQALATTDAAKGSAQYLGLQAQLAQALDSLRVAEKGLAEEQRRAAALRRSAASEDQKTLVAQQNAIDDLAGRRAAAEREATRIVVGGHAGAGPQGTPAERLAQQVRDFVKATQEAAGANPNALVRRELLALAAVSDALGRLPSEKQIRVVVEATSAREGILQLLEGLEAGRPKVQAFAASLEREAAILSVSNPSLSRRLDLLAQFADAVHRVPSRHETELVLRAPDFKTAEEGLLKVLGKMDADAGAGGSKSGHSFVATFAAALKSDGGLLSPLLSAVESAVKKIGQDAGDSASVAVKDSTNAAREAARVTAQAAKSTLAGVDSKLDSAKQAARDAADAVKQSNEQVSDAEHGVRQAGLAVADAERGVADAIKSGAKAVADAVSQANQNLFSIGASLSDVIGQFLDAQAKTQTALTGPQAAEIRRLRAQIIAGQGGPDTERAAQELAARIEAAQSKGQQGGLDKRKERVKRDVADLVDEFNKGAISIETFNRRLAAILSREGITYKRAGKLLGEAFADGFRAEIEGLKKQAAAIAAGPRRPGVTGLEPTIVRPLDALRESQKQIAASQRSRDDALYQKTIAIRNLADSQDQHAKTIESEAKAQHRLATLQAQHQKAIEASAKATQRSSSLIEQHTRYLADRARREGAHTESGARAGAAGAGRGGADLGHALGAGVAGGVRGEVANVVSAVEELVAAALHAGRRKARAKSPSVETQELGYDIGRGLILGIEGSHAAAGDAAEGLVGHLLERATASARLLAQELRGRTQKIAAPEFPLEGSRRPVELGRPAVDAIERFLRQAEAERADRDRELVGAVQALGRLEERIGRDSLGEERRQTEELRRIHETQRRPEPPRHAPRRPGGAASAKARMTATHHLET